VGNLLLEVVSRLQTRAVNHDQSKFSSEEFELFAQETPGLKALTYNSPEYKAALGRLGPALNHHYSMNDHHPEHYPATVGVSNVYQMDLICLMEMLADWKAATERHADGSLARSIIQNAKRFGYDDNMVRILGKTALNMGWITCEQCLEVGIAL
jgi:hypothetical protein